MLENINCCTIFMTLELKALLRQCSNWTHGHWLVRSFLAQRLFNPRKTIGYEYFSVASDRFRDSHKNCHSEVLVALCLSVSKISFIGATSSSQRLRLLFHVGYFSWISIPETKLCHNKLFWRNHFLKSCLKSNMFLHLTNLPNSCLKPHAFLHSVNVVQLGTSDHTLARSSCVTNSEPSGGRVKFLVPGTC